MRCADTDSAVPETPSVQEVCARVAHILKSERLAQNLSMTRVAEGASLSRQMVSYVERGLRVPTLDTLIRLTRVLEVSAAEVISRATDGKQDNPRQK